VSSPPRVRDEGEDRTLGNPGEEAELGDLTVIVPVLNEEEGVGKVVDELLRTGVPRENIVVIDGNSTDRTREEAVKRGVRAVVQDGRGKADAVKTGIRLTKTRYVVVIDGDYTYPASRIRDLVKEAEKKGLDEVIGARTRLERGSMGVAYRIGNKILTKFFNLLFGTRLRDVLSGLYLVRRDALQDALVEMKGFSIESEIAAHVASTTGRIGEIDVEYRRRLGRKKLGIRHGITIAIDMVRLAYRYNPAFLIFAAGGLLLIPGLVLDGYVAYYYFFHGVKYHVKGAIGIFITLLGFQSLLLAVLALFIKRMEQRLRALITSRNK
jgi:glycosyltransferase involved in cell wall biosynthesis